MNMPDPTTQLAPLMDGTDAAEDFREQLPHGGTVTPADAGPSLRELAEDLDPEEAEEAGLPGQTIHVVFESGSGLEPITVRTVNKDYLRWDRTPAARRGGIRNFQDAPFLFATFLAWAGAKREGLTALSFDQFAELAEQVERKAAHEVPPTQ